MKLGGKVALITPAGSGIGRAGALRFAREGAAVAVVDLDAAGAEETAALVTTSGGKAIAITCDVGNEEWVDTSYRAVIQQRGRLDILYSNSGIPMTVPLARLTPEQWDRVMDTNTRGTFLMARHAARPMDGRGGAIISTASTASLVPANNRAAYIA